MDEYTLYLDESRNKERTKFVIAGIIVKNTDIDMLSSSILNAKKCIWDDEYIKNNHPILHCVELTSIKDNRKNSKTLPKLLNQYSNYSIWADKDKAYIKKAYDDVYIKLSKAIKDVNGVVLGCLMDVSRLTFLYGENIKSKQDLFFEIAMQEIIENYTHFLLKNNAVGYIVYESRNGDDAITNKSADVKMFDNFCKIKICNKGISFMEQKSVIERVKYLTIHGKKEDIAGLQLADFIAYNITHLKQLFIKDPNNDFANKIFDNTYNGTYDIHEKDLRYYFGIKQLPFDFQRITILEDENAKLKNSNDSLKTERKKLTKKISLLTEKKELLISQNNELKKEVNELKEKLTNR